jgi:hypothetical protein
VKAQPQLDVDVVELFGQGCALARIEPNDACTLAYRQARCGDAAVTQSDDGQALAAQVEQ